MFTCPNNNNNNCTRLQLDTKTMLCNRPMFLKNETYNDGLVSNPIDKSEMIGILMFLKCDFFQVRCCVLV